MLNKNEILDKSKNNLSLIGIYFLIKNNKIVYVGQSVNIFKRIADHIRSEKMDFDSYSFENYPKKNLNLIEAEYIIKFEPKLNSYMLPKNSKYAPINSTRKKYDLKAKAAERIIKKYELKTFYNNNYVLRNEFIKFYKIEKEKKFKSNVVNKLSYEK